MKNMTTGDIKEIAEQLDCNFLPFVHKTTGEMLFVPDINHYLDIDLDSWQEELEALKSNPSDYYKIDTWTSSEAFGIMRDFADEVTNSHFQSRLLGALRKNKPFREFKFVIDNSGEFRQAWFDFKNKRQEELVAE